MKTLHTPLIDVVLAANPSLSARFTAAKEALLQSIEAGVIYKVQFENAKYSVMRAVEESLKPSSQAFWDAYRDSTEMRQLDVSQYIQFNQVKARQRGLKKYAHLPTVAPYLAILAEIQVLADAFAAAKSLIVKGRVPSATPKAVDFTNTGTCAICGRRHKLEADKNMVHHGFRISDGFGNYFGQRHGKCFGCAYQPYELSCEGNKAYKVLLKERKEGRSQYLVRLTTGAVTEFADTQRKRIPGGKYARYVEETVIIKQGDEDFPGRLKYEIAKVENDIRSLTAYIRLQTEAIAAWKLAPLP